MDPPPRARPRAALSASSYNGSLRAPVGDSVAGLFRAQLPANKRDMLNFDEIFELWDMQEVVEASADVWKQTLGAEKFRVLAVKIKKVVEAARYATHDKRLAPFLSPHHNVASQGCASHPHVAQVNSGHAEFCCIAPVREVRIRQCSSFFVMYAHSLYLRSAQSGDGCGQPSAPCPD